MIRLCLLLMAASGVAVAADGGALRAVLLPPQDRKAAPEFVLKNQAGKSVRLSAYRGKIVLLDFWATWCTGCKKELPLFSDFQKTYGKKRLAVVGVSIDDEGWKVVKPYLASIKPAHTMLLSDELTIKQYEIGNMPNTFLIDRQGRVAASYRGGLIDRDDVDAHIKALLLP